MKKPVPLIILLGACALFAGCDESVGAFDCPYGEVVLVGDETLCITDENVVTETGFLCGGERPHRGERDGAIICSSSSELEDAELDDAVARARGHNR